MINLVMTSLLSHSTASGGGSRDPSSPSLDSFSKSDKIGSRRYRPNCTTNIFIQSQDERPW